MKILIKFVVNSDPTISRFNGEVVENRVFEVEDMNDKELGKFIRFLERAIPVAVCHSRKRMDFKGELNSDEIPKPELDAKPNRQRFIMRKKEVMKKIGFSSSTMWRLEHMGEFPARIRLSKYIVGWDKDEVEAWLHSRTRVPPKELVATTSHPIKILVEEEKPEKKPKRKYVRKMPKLAKGAIKNPYARHLEEDQFECGDEYSGFGYKYE
jgi:predicted DNA-binding transcriptional regulator AlpA